MDTQKITHEYRINKWTEIIRECRSSGQTVTSWCKDHDINPKSYYYRLKQVRAAACSTLPALSTGTGQIVPLNVQESVPSLTDTERSSDIILRMETVILELHNTASATLIENTLRALRNVR